MSGQTAERSGRIGLRRHLRAQVVPGGPVHLFDETGVTALHGQHVDDLVALLDCSRAEIAVRDGMARRGVDAEDVTSMLDELAAADLLVRHPDAADAVPASTLAFWDAAGVSDAWSAAERIARGRVALCAVGGTEPGEMVRGLERAGVGGVEVTAPGAVPERGAALTVALCSDYRDPGLAAVAAAARRAGTPLLLVKPAGCTIWVGPFLDPDGGPCWTCLDADLAANRPAGGAAAPDGTDGTAAEPQAPTVGLPALTAAACDLGALEVAKWLAGFRDPVQARLRTMNSLTLAVESHDVRARPQCRVCGDPGLQSRAAWEPVTVSSRPCAPGAVHRAVTDSETMRRHRRLVSPLTGVVTEIRRDRRGPAEFHSVRAGTNRATAGHGSAAVRSTLRWDNGGKGVTAEQAEVGALCEAVERYSGTFHDDEATSWSSFADLGAGAAIHPDACRLFDPRQIANREAWNPLHSAFQQIPPEFDEHRRLPWTPVWSMTAGRHRMLPTAMLYFRGPGGGGLWADSNGCAAGSSREDAILQGLLEIVERDAVAQWWYNRLRLPGIELPSCGDAWVAGMPEVYRRCGREVWALDLTADLGVPVVAALSRRVGGSRDDVMLGFGAHLTPALALRRALTELNQVLPAVIDLPDGDLPPVADHDLRHWLRTATVAGQPHLVPADVPRIPVRCGPGGTDSGADVTALRELVEDAGHDVLVLDQTRPDIGLPVVRTIVPGMRSFWARFAPGRLFDVPVRLGRLDRPTPYADLNPFPIFL